MKYWISLAGAVALFASAHASATLINFEDAPSHGLQDNDQVTNQYAGEGVTFNGAFLEYVGGVGPSDTNPQGFLNDQTGKWDDPAAPGLGNWFLRSGGEVSDRGGQGVYLSVSYTNPVTAASGQIWDIDGNGSQGSEQWAVLAYLGDDLVYTDTSPEGTTNGPGSLDGLPWTFNLLNDGGFDRIDFVFIGSKKNGTGLAFDNFRTDAVAVPEPAVLAMLGFGTLLIGLFASLRRRMGQGD